MICFLVWTQKRNLTTWNRSHCAHHMSRFITSEWYWNLRVRLWILYFALCHDFFLYIYVRLQCGVWNILIYIPIIPNIIQGYTGILESQFCKSWAWCGIYCQLNIPYTYIKAKTITNLSDPHIIESSEISKLGLYTYKYMYIIYIYIYITTCR